MTVEWKEDREHQVHRKGQRGELVAREKLAGREGEVRGDKWQVPPCPTPFLQTLQIQSFLHG